MYIDVQVMGTEDEEGKQTNALGMGAAASQEAVKVQ